MRLVKVEDLRKEIEIISQNHEREVDRKDAIIQVHPACNRTRHGCSTEISRMTDYSPLTTHHSPLTTHHSPPGDEPARLLPDTLRLATIHTDATGR